jgi:hypothetical protein
VQIAEEYGDMQPLASVPAALAPIMAGYARFDGWERRSGYSTYLRLDFIDPAGGEHATFTLPVWCFELTQGDRSLEIEVVGLEAGAWPWVDRVMQEGGDRVRELAAGRGFVIGGGAALDLREALVRATLGAPSLPPGAEEPVLAELFALGPG